MMRGAAARRAPTTRMVETPRSVHRERTRVMNGLIGSLSGATSACMRASRIIKLVADVSSSSSNAELPASSASMIAAACDVEPDASVVVKLVVRLPNGRWSMNGEMSTPWHHHHTTRASTSSSEAMHVSPLHFC